MRGRNERAKGYLFAVVHARTLLFVFSDWGNGDRGEMGGAFVTAVAMLRAKRWSYFLRLPPGAGLPSPSCSLFSVGTTQHTTAQSLSPAYPTPASPIPP